ncbi:MAG: hypothetical protein H7175_06370 [Burkholderiales bacterium]|nr:hypothetical protein [Anaerolineae bacterium]
MAYKLEWLDNDQTVLHLVMEGEMTWEEFYEAMRELKNWVTSVDHPVSTITDVGNAKPMSLSNVLKLKPAFADKAENTRLSVVVGLPAFQQTMVNLFTNLYKQLAGEVPIVFVKTMEEAQALAAREIAK